MANAPGIRQTFVEPAQDFEADAPESAAALAEFSLLAAPEKAANPCKPLRRASIPTLYIMDDGQRSAQIVRIRKTPFQIGRTVGEVRIVHDDAIADPHIEISFSNHQLSVRNLTAQADLFLRVTKWPMSAGQIIRLGSTQFQYDDPGGLRPLNAPDGTNTRWLRQMGEKVTIGREVGAQSIVVVDPLVDRVHAFATRDLSGKWYIVDNGSRNGTWVAVGELQVEKMIEFSVGEQVFRLENPQCVAGNAAH